MNSAKYTICAATLGGLLCAVWLPSIVSAQPDSPIIVRDGSIEIQNQNGNMSQWRVANRTTLEHPDQTKTMGVVDVTGPGARNTSCAGRGRCVVEIRWSTGQVIRVVAAQAGSRAMRLEAAGVTFDDPAWNKTTPVWRFTLPANATPTVTIRDQSTNGQAQTVCQGRGCSVTVHYR
jgi:hypothetical protein